MRVIVTGQIAQYPLGGVTWFYLQYLLGLKSLGHDVFYFEDSGQWPYNPSVGGVPEDPRYNVKYLAETLNGYDLGDRWAYRFPWGPEWFGLSDAARVEALKTADLVLNVSGTLRAPDELVVRSRLAYIDTDPVFTQIKLLRGQDDFRALVDAHDVHLSYGERIAQALPDTGHSWIPTRAPVMLSEWVAHEQPRKAFTTITNWTAFKPIEFQGVSYGQKDIEFKRFLDLPKLVAPAVLELAIGPGNKARTPYELLEHKGWKLVDPDKVCPDLENFRTYVRASYGEWSVAKHGYVQGQSGWFSERSARYLAAGRPAVLQDTGFSQVLPVGEGLLPFVSIDGAAKAIGDVQADYKRHSKAAREIAEEYFDASLVLDSLVEQAMAYSGRRTHDD